MVRDGRVHDTEDNPTPFAQSQDVPVPSGAPAEDKGLALAPSASPSAWRFVAPVLIVFISLLAFMPALDAGFVYWDDDDILLDNPRYRNLDFANLRWMFTTSYAGHFQPLTWLSYSLDYALWDGSAFGFHLGNFVFHVLAALSFYFVARRLFAIAVRDHHAVRSAPFVLSAAFAAMLFAVHPLRAESVAWLAERRDVLGGFLYLLAIGSYLRYATGQEPALPRVRKPFLPRWSFYVGTVLLCGLSLLAKATAVTMPVVLLILDVYPLRRLGHRRGLWGNAASRVWIEKVPLFVLAIAGGIRAIAAQDQGGALYPLTGHDLVARIAQACYGLMFYAWKTLWPMNLGPIYEIPPRDVLLGRMFWLSAAFVVVVAFAVIRLRRRCPAIGAALAVYVVTLAPVLGFLQSGPQLVADRYSYLSCLGLAALGGAVLLQCLRSNRWWGSSARRALVGLAAATLVVLCEWGTFRQADTWISALKLWEHAVRVSPGSSVAHVNYADALARIESPGKAMEHYYRGLELDPSDPVALHHLGDLFRLLGRRETAIGYYIQSLRIDPNRRNACYSLVQQLRNTGRPHEAVAVLRDGIARHPDDLEMMTYLARMLSSHPDESIRSGEEAVRLASSVSAMNGNGHARSLLTLATALAEANRFDETVTTIERAVAIAEARESTILLSQLEYRLRLFREGRAYRTRN